MRPSFDRTPGALPRLIRAAACACVLLVASVAVRAVAGNITIIRDTWGIPHVFSNSDEGAMFGAGYATAEDRLFQMHRNRRAVQGRLAELVGNMPGGSFGSTVQQDVYFRHHQLYKYSQRAAANLDVGTQRLLNAYCDGVNHYITTHAGQLHYLFAGQTPEPWTPADCVAVWNRMADYFGAGSSAFGKSRQQHEFERLVAQFGLEAAIEMFVGTPVVDESAAVVLPADLPQTTVDAMYQYAIDHGFGNGTPLQGPPNTFSGAESAKFSHAWVVAGARSTTGAALLHSDPQTAVASPSLFYELHVRGQTFDARGIGTAGCPGFLIGFNRRIAWGLTALGADMADLFELQSTGPNQYSYDGAPYMMDVSNEQILVRNGTPVPITVRDSIIGPVVTPLCQDVHTGEEFVLQTLPSHDAARHTVQGTIAMMRGETLATFIDALDGWRHPGANIVFGDDLGNIAYWTLAAIPVRSALAPVGPRIAQDGSASQYQWQETLPLHVRPHVINPARGAIWSGNHLPIGSWYPIPLALGTGGGGDTTRSWRLAERLAGSAVLSPADMLTVHRDDVNPARRVVLRAGYHLRDTLGVTLSTPAMNALNILESWYANGAHGALTEPFYAAAYHMNLSFRQNDAPNLVPIYGGGESGLCHFLKTLDQRLNRDPLASISVDERAYIDRVLSIGWNTAVSNYGASTANWQNGMANGPGTYSAPYFQTLEGFGSLDPTHNSTWPSLRVVDGGTILSQRAQSYSQALNLAQPDAALAIMPLGSSEQPASPHWTSQAPLWQSDQLRAAPLDRTIVESLATATLTLNYFPQGDLNCDGRLNNFDIDPFVLLLTDPAGYAAAHPGCDPLHGDLNGDGQVNNFDIDPFVMQLAG